MSDYSFAFVGTKLLENRASTARSNNEKKNSESTTTNMGVIPHASSSSMSSSRQKRKHEQQIATDEQGRRRFHGAFTGGFSAGYFNTVGSKEGWQPKQFKSSRGSSEGRYEQQSMKDFMDEDELEEYERGMMRTNAEYDAFGKEGEAMAGFRRIEGDEEDGAEEEDGTNRRMALFGTTAEEKEKAMRGEGGKRGFSKSLARSILDYVKPVISGIGTKLLVKMGWRVGKSLGRRKKKVKGKIVFKAMKEDEQAWKTRYEQQLVSVLGGDVVNNTKDNSWGIGYDPYAGAEEFRKRDQHELMKKRERYSKEGEKKQRGMAFGLGAFEADDDMNVYDERPRERNAEYSFELKSEDEEDGDDENERFGRGADHRQKDALRNPLGVKRLPDRATRDAIERGQKFPGFVESDAIPEEVEWFQAPEVPKEFNERHVFDTGDVADDMNEAEEEKEEEILPPPPPQMQKLSDEKRKVIESLARFVARNGEAFEQLAKQKQKNEKKFSFLFGGEGASSYAYCLKKAKLEEKRNARKLLATAKRKIAPLLSAAKGEDISKQRKHDAESRGILLGEEPLKRTVPPPPPQAQVEKMKIPARGQPIAENIKKVNLSAAINEKDKKQILATMSNMFTTSGQIVNADMPSAGLQTAKELAKIREEREKLEAVEAANLKNVEKEREAQREAMSRMIVNTRTTVPWSPALLLCKRLGIPDPYAGREYARPAKFRASFKTETVDLLPETTQIRLEKQPKFMSKKEREEMKNKKTDDEDDETKVAKAPKDDEDEVEEEHAPSGQLTQVPPPPPPLPLREKPMDLFKAIFEDSDDEEEEEEDESSSDEEGGEEEKEKQQREEEGGDLEKQMPPPKFIPRPKKFVDPPPPPSLPLATGEEKEKPPVFLKSSAFGKNRSDRKRDPEDSADDEDDRRRKRSKRRDKERKKKKEKKRRKEKKRKDRKDKKRKKKRSRRDDSSSSSSSDSDSYSSSS